jgi:putative ABC transport system substrate-binding protein
MRRREVLIGGSACAFVPAEALEIRMRRVAVFHPTEPVSRQTENSLSGVVWGEVARHGFEQGKNLSVERYSGGGQPEIYRQIAARVAASQPDVIYTYGSVISGLFAEATGGKIPIVAWLNDPKATGLSDSISSPTGSVTGVIVDAGFELIGKRFEILRELCPSLQHVALLVPRYVWDVETGTANATRGVAAQLGIRLTHLGPGRPIDAQSYREAFGHVRNDRPDAIIAFEGPELYTYRQVVVELINESGIPAIYSMREFVEFGGLIAYTFDYAVLARHIGRQIADALRGIPVADIPFFQPDQFQLLVNTRTANEQGLTIPATLLARADEVIE